MRNKLAVLLAEDSENDAILLTMQLEKDGYDRHLGLHHA
jgi:hypothetical protein